MKEEMGSVNNMTVEEISYPQGVVENLKETPQQRWRKKNKDKIREYNRKQYLRMPEKTRQKRKEWHQNNREKVLELHRKKRLLIDAWWNEYKKGLSCSDCGESHPSCLDFHHKNQEEKEINISGMRRRTTKDKILKEVEKCIVLCANCHRKLHYELRSNGGGNGT